MNCPQGVGALWLLAPRVPIGSIVIREVFHAEVLHFLLGNVAFKQRSAMHMGMASRAQGYKIVLMVGATFPAGYAMMDLDILRAIA